MPDPPYWRRPRRSGAAGGIAERGWKAGPVGGRWAAIAVPQDSQRDSPVSSAAINSFFCPLYMFFRGRLAECGLELNDAKTKVIYCKDDDRKGRYEHVKFDFLGYTFQPRRAKNRWGGYFVSFLRAISAKAAKAMRSTIRGWRLASTRNNQELEDLARLSNPAVRGWMNYCGRFYRSKCVQVLRHLNKALARWARRKCRRFKRRERASMNWLGRIARRDPSLFVLWQLGVRPEAGG